MSSAAASPQRVPRRDVKDAAALVELFRAGVPVVLSGACRDWPAFSQWALRQLSKADVGLASRVATLRVHPRPAAVTKECSSRTDTAPAGDSSTGDSTTGNGDADECVACCSCEAACTATHSTAAADGTAIDAEQLAAAVRSAGGLAVRCGSGGGGPPDGSSPAWESDGDVGVTSVRRLCAWALGGDSAACDDGTGGATGDADVLHGKSVTRSWAYLDYRHLKDVFAGDAAGLASAAALLPWSSLAPDATAGFPPDGRHSTLWIGVAGASTPLHQDTYGCNIVAQIDGVKHWTLFAPHETPRLYPTRLPYEESSVFSSVGAAGFVSSGSAGGGTGGGAGGAGDAGSGAARQRSGQSSLHPLFADATPLHALLLPGDVLFVPRHYWHFVESVTASVSANQWIPMPDDEDSRVSEAAVRVLATALLPPAAADSPALPMETTGRTAPLDARGWVNPTESLWAERDGYERLAQLLQDVGGNDDDEAQQPSPVSAALARRLLMDAVLHPQNVDAVVAHMRDNLQRVTRWRSDTQRQRAADGAGDAQPRAKRARRSG